MKKTIKYTLVIILVLIEGYLLATFVGGNMEEKKRVETFCEQKCDYNQASYFWEFSGENITRGFTTKDECNSYCIKKEQGFVYGSVINARNFLGSLFKK